MHMYMQGFIWKLGKCIETIRKARSCFDKTLCLGMGVFPENEELKDLKNRYVEGLRLIDEGNANNGLNRGNTSAGMSRNENVDFSTPNIEKVIGRASGSVTGGVGFDSPEYHFGQETQAIVIATADKVTSAALKGKAVANDDVPSYSLGFTQSSVCHIFPNLL